MEQITERITRIYCAHDVIEIRTTLSAESIRDRGRGVHMAAADFVDALEAHTSLEFRDELERVIQGRTQAKSHHGGK